MKNPCLVKELEGERYLLDNLQLGPKTDAFIGDQEACVRLAERACGADWRDRVSIQELGFSEYMSIIGARGGRVMTESKYRHIRSLGKLKSKLAAYNRRRREHRREEKRAAQRQALAEKRVAIQSNRFWWYNETFAVRWPTIGGANRQVRRFCPSVARGELRKVWKKGKPPGHFSEEVRDGVYKLMRHGWERQIE